MVALLSQYKLLSCRYVESLSYAILLLFLNKVTINLYMFCSFMKNRIQGNVDGCLVVAIQFRWLWMWDFNQVISQ